jgi:hypothetical protein
MAIPTGTMLAGESKEPDLSDAMEKSASGDKTPMEDTRSHKSNDEDYSDTDSEDGGGFFGELIFGALTSLHGVHYEERDYVWQIPVDAAYLVPLNGDIQGITRFSIMPLSIEGEHALFGLYFNGGLVNFKNGSLPDAATSGATTLGVGMGFRYYFSGPEKTWSPYLGCSLGWQQLAWSYRHPIVVGNDTINDDSLSALDTYAGVGVAFRRNRWFSLFGEAGFGGSILSSETDEGFHNDVFDDFAWFAAKLGFSLKF